MTPIHASGISFHVSLGEVLQPPVFPLIFDVFFCRTLNSDLIALFIQSDVLIVLLTDF